MQTIKLNAMQLSLMIFILVGAMSNNVFANEVESYPVDQASGLIKAPGWKMVKQNCTVCHSAKLVTAQRGNRLTWVSMIRWMQKTQGLWEIPSKTESTILDYLAEHYAPNTASRRANLPAHLMPKAHD